MTTNETLRDDAVRHAIYVERFKASEVRKIAKFLKRVEADIVNQLAENPETLTEWGTRRLKAMLREVRAIHNEIYKELDETFIADLTDLLDVEATFAVGSLTAATPMVYNYVAPSPETIRSAVFSRPFAGKLLREWVKDLDTLTVSRIEGAIKQGVVEGETYPQIIRRVKTASGINQRAARAMVTTAVNHITTQAREQVYKANEDVLEGVQWLSTLDGKTSDICKARDGKVFPVGSGPRPPAHPHCRSTTVPVTKAAKFYPGDADPLTRSAMDGKVAGDETYATWLKKQPASFQNEVLGRTKAKLFRDGKLTLDKFVNMQTGENFSVADLKKKYPQFF